MTGTSQDNGFINSQDMMFSLHPDLLFFIESALADEDQEGVLELIADLHAADIVEIINNLDHHYRKLFAETIQGNFSPEILVGLEGAVKDEIITILGSKVSANAITQLETDDAIHVIEDLETNEQHELLDEMSAPKRAELEEGLSYPEDSAGRLMNPNYVSMHHQWNVGQAIDYLRSTEDMPVDFHEIYVLDDDDKPLGGVLTSRIIRMNRGVMLVDIMSENTKAIDVHMDQEEAAYIFQKYGLVSAPVINHNEQIVGVLSLDNILDVIEEEAEEDILRLAGVKEHDINLSTFHTARYRTPWLFINLLTAIAASAVISVFEVEIAQLVALAVMMPIVASMAGNAGTQTMTITVRALATKEINASNTILVTIKETIAASINGLIFALIAAGASFLFYENIELSLVFAGAILLSLILAALAGVLIPLILDKSGADPAIASTVFLTTVTDISAFLIFLGLARLLLF